MARTVDEKYKYNKSRKDDFGDGYCIGVNLYQGYVKRDTKGRQQTHEIVDRFMQLAKNGDKLSKGIIAGYRDAANERKARKNTLS